MFCLDVCLYTMCVPPFLRKWKRVSDPLRGELQLWAKMWGLGLELKSSTRTASVLNCWTVSPNLLLTSSKMRVSLCVGVGTNTRIRTILKIGLGQILTVRLKHWWARVVMRIGFGDLVVVFKITTPHIVPRWWASFTMPLSTGTVGTWIWGKHKSVFQGQHQNGSRTNYLLCPYQKKNSGQLGQ